VGIDEVYMRRLTRRKRVKTPQEEIDEVGGKIEGTKELFADLKRSVTELEKQLDDIGKKHERERKKELAKELDKYR